MEFVKVEHVILEDGAMPKLRRAVFHKCPGLKFNCLPEQTRCLGSNLHFVEAYNDDELQMMIDFPEALDVNQNSRPQRTSLHVLLDPHSNV
ncbi:hypothetical protein PIB30_040683 [Stylosanthes scabra]|uniref:Uncharacterized protein n=1 Tax=Stylosanthes scabra TaxID=79078 RepID=A0ABU6QFF6_9FABA|nr:hypothetical protein [Stylosanthes scabra]